MKSEKEIRERLDMLKANKPVMFSGEKWRSWLKALEWVLDIPDPKDK